MAAVQMMCARIGKVTGQGLAGNFKQRFPRGCCSPSSSPCWSQTRSTLRADLAGMADAASMLSGINSHWFVVVFALLISWATVRLQYHQIANVLKWLVLVLFAYPITAFVVGADWGQVLRDTLMPSMPHSQNEWATLVAILGTTSAPICFSGRQVKKLKRRRRQARARSPAERSYARRAWIEKHRCGRRRVLLEHGHVLHHSDHRDHSQPARHHEYRNLSAGGRSPAALCRQLRCDLVHTGYCRRRFSCHPHAGRIGRIRLRGDSGMAPGLEQETETGALVLRSDSWFRREWALRWTLSASTR